MGFTSNELRNQTKTLIRMLVYDRTVEIDNFRIDHLCVTISSIFRTVLCPQHSYTRLVGGAQRFTLVSQRMCPTHMASNHKPF